jgi:hypothetical protein
LISHTPFYAAGEPLSDRLLERYLDGMADADEHQAAAQAASDAATAAFATYHEFGLTAADITVNPETDGPKNGPTRNARWVARSVLDAVDESWRLSQLPSAEGLAAYHAGRAAVGAKEAARQCDLLRCLFGNAFRPAPAVDPTWQTWHGSVVPNLVRAAYQARGLPEGTLENQRLVILADALEDTGCSDAELLGHLRGPGPHVRGCWALDLILSRE